MTESARDLFGADGVRPTTVTRDIELVDAEIERAWRQPADRDMAATFRRS